MIRSNKDVDVDVDDNLLETPTAEATIAAIKDGEDAIARAEAALPGGKHQRRRRRILRMRMRMIISKMKTLVLLFGRN